ncbi:hypothetical protein IMG5_051990 [Ichthyophthirius multifiliis]|uniref:Uncharacterized protein n=1 Tax=Ichthyophthirius multifiliis TaxID=5932 RepID=G0QMU8_ICHMU|nr:hypothetical protein IMG5_051990 [Ichthyophthirius multifiliis]EGR33458.1 hypothetical protein IMG5_051990 [Ichthyophthirius multifiliis]|eukprot:XP_004037444.1 hypothetical protein IMG5_051990 [Ichthyophthirius multifiliis]
MSKQQQQNQLRELQKPLWTKLNQLRSFFKSIHVCVQVQKVTQIPETKQIELTLADNTGLARAILSEGAVDPNLIKVGNKIALRNAKTKYIDNKLVIIINKWGCITDENNSGLFEGQALELNNEQLNISEKKYDFKNIEIGKISPNEQVYNVLVKVIERKSVPLIQNNRKEEGGENLHQDKANLHVKLADKTGIINAIFPDLPKFRGLFEPNQNLQLVKAYVLQTEIRTKDWIIQNLMEELLLYLKMKLKIYYQMDLIINLRKILVTKFGITSPTTNYTRQQGSYRNQYVTVQPRPHEWTEYQPIEKKYIDYVPETKVEYRPVERSFLDYVEIKHVTDYQPVKRVQKRVEYVPVEYYDEYLDYNPKQYSYYTRSPKNVEMRASQIISQDFVQNPNYISQSGYKSQYFRFPYKYYH